MLKVKLYGAGVLAHAAKSFVAVGVSLSLIMAGGGSAFAATADATANPVCPPGDEGSQQPQKLSEMERLVVLDSQGFELLIEDDIYASAAGKAFNAADIVEVKMSTLPEGDPAWDAPIGRNRPRHVNDINNKDQGSTQVSRFTKRMSFDMRWENKDGKLRIYSGAPTTMAQGQFSRALRIKYKNGKTSFKNIAFFNLTVDTSAQQEVVYEDEDLPAKEDIEKQIKFNFIGVQQTNVDSLKTSIENDIIGISKIGDTINPTDISSGLTKKTVSDNSEKKTEPTSAGIDQDLYKSNLIVKIPNNTPVRTLQGCKQSIRFALPIVIKDTKTPLKNKLKQLAAEQTKVIDDNKLLTTEEKAKHKEDIAANLTESLQAIDSGKHRDFDVNPSESTHGSAEETRKAAEKALEMVSGFQESLQVEPQPEVIPAALQEMQAKLQAKQDEIKQDSHLTVEEQEKQIQELAAQFENIKTKLQAGNLNNEQVRTISQEFLTQLDEVIPQAETKPNLVHEVRAAAAAKISAIEANKQLTTEEKAEAKQQVENAKAAAVKRIEVAEHESEASEAKTQGITAINAVNPQPVTKNEALAAVRASADQKLKLIDSTPDLTDDEKQSYKDAVEAQVTAAIEEINKATGNTDVTKAKEAGVDKITQITPKADVKPLSREAVNAKAQEQIAKIQQNNELTDEEKAQAVEAINAAKQKALDAIELQTKTAEVQKVANDAKAEIGQIDPAPAVKPAAKAALRQAAEQKRAEVAASSLTDDEKRAAVKQVTDALEAAEKAVDAATKTADVSAERERAEKQIADMTFTSAQKDAAKKAINDATAQKIKDIQDNDQLTTEEKTQAVAEVNAEKDKYLAEVDKQTTDAAVDSVKQTALQTISAINPQPDTKNAAIAAVQNAAAEKAKTVAADKSLTDEEKEQAQEELRQLSADAIDAINKAESAALVDQAKDAGIAAINGLNPQPDTKNAARDRLIKKVTARQQEVADSKELTEEEKAAANQRLEEGLQAGFAAIADAESNQNVADVLDVAVKNIEGMQFVPETKNTARAELEAAAQEQIAKIQQNDEFTDEEKAQAVEAINTVKQQALDAIELQTKTADVLLAANSAKAEIGRINPVPKVKPDAVKAVVAAVAAKLEEIAASSLTDEEKQAAISRVNAVADPAKTAISDAMSNQAVAAAHQKAVQEIQALSFTSAKKDAAKNAIEDAAAKKTAEIKNNKDLTAEEVQKAVAEVNAEKDKYLAEVAKQTTDAQVEEQQAAALQGINAIDPQPDIKNAARDRLIKKVNARQQEVADNKELTEEEKAAANQRLEEALQAGFAAIADAESNQNVADVLDVAVKNVEGMQFVPETKNTARAELEAAFNAKKQSLIDNREFTVEERDSAIVALRQVYAAGLQSVAGAETDAAVADAKAWALKQITDFNAVAAVRSAAKQYLADKLAAKKAVLEGSNELTAEEKAAAFAELDARFAEADKQVSEVADNAAVEAAKNAGGLVIDGVNPQPVVKQTAREAVREVAERQRQQVAGNSALTTEEKENAFNKISLALADALQQIAAQNSNEGVTQAQNAGVAALQAINPEPVTKNSAKAQLRDAAAAKTAAVRSDAKLTEEEKAAAVQTVQKELDKALAAVDSAVSAADVANAKDRGLEAIQQINPVPETKDAALAAVRAALAQKNKTIDATSSLTLEEKQAARKAAAAAADKTIAEINAAATAAMVTASKFAGVEAINSVKLEAKTKTAAFAQIERVLAEKLQELANMQGLTLEEKSAVRSQLLAAADVAKAAVAAAETDATVAEAIEKGLLALTINLPQPTEKQRAKALVDSVAQAQIAKIKQTQGLAAAQKDHAVAEISERLAEALKAIDSAVDKQAVAKIVRDFMDAVHGINPVPQQKLNPGSLLATGANMQFVVWLFLLLALTGLGVCSLQRKHADSV